VSVLIQAMNGSGDMKEQNPYVLMEQKKSVMIWHLGNNLYPPVGYNMTEFALKAVELVSNGHPGIVPTISVDGKQKTLKDNDTGKPVTAIEIVENWRLHDFIGSEEQD